MPISDCQVRDPRIRRTRKLLQGALATLMESKSFDEISVQDVTDIATVNRATFYDHYSDKFALLEAMVAAGFHEFLNQRNLRYDASCPAALGAIVCATCEFLISVHSTGSCDRQTAFQPLMDAAITSAIRGLLVEGLSRAERRSALPAELMASAASAAICGGVKYSLSLPERPDTHVIVAQLVQLVLPMLDLAGELPAAAAVHSH